MTRARNIANPTQISIPIDVTANITSNAVISVGNTEVNTLITETTIVVGNSSVNTIIHSTGITANGANIHSVNAASVGGNTASDLRGYSDTAYSNAVSVASTDATNKASNAYSNSTSFASNASNISSGTLNIARISDGAVTAAKLASTAVTDKLGYTPQQGTLFYPVVRYNTWSRVFRMSVGPLWAGAIVSISHTRNNFVHGSVHVLGGGHSGGASMSQLVSHGYSQAQVGIESDDANDWYFILKDYTTGSAGVDYTWTCKVIPLIGNVTNYYTSFNGQTNTIRASYTTAYGGTGTNASSDARLKTDVQQITNAVDKIKQLNGYTFFKDGNVDRDVGLIAQEVLEVLPEAVTGLPSPNTPDDIKQQILESESYVLGLKYGQMSALFVEAIKEQQTQIDQLKAQIQTLQGN